MFIEFMGIIGLMAFRQGFIGFMRFSGSGACGV